jgi:hypothetical protein
MLTRKVLVFAVISLLIAALAITAAAQTEVTTNGSGSTDQVPKFSNAPIPVYNTDGTPVPSVHAVVGHIMVPAGWGQDVRSPQFSSGIPVTLEGAAAFTSADSYTCFVSEIGLGGSTTLLAMFRKVDGSHFSIRTGAPGRSWRQDFFCIGN